MEVQGRTEPRGGLGPEEHARGSRGRRGGAGVPAGRPSCTADLAVSEVNWRHPLSTHPAEAAHGRDAQRTSTHGRFVGFLIKMAQLLSRYHVRIPLARSPWDAGLAQLELAHVRLGYCRLCPRSRRVGGQQSKRPRCPSGRHQTLPCQPSVFLKSPVAARDSHGCTRSSILHAHMTYHTPLHVTLHVVLVPFCPAVSPV